VRLSETSSVPLHAQLRSLLESDIKEEKFTTKIPSERDLMEKYQVSRATVREAISLLVIDGLLEKRQGKGTFIKQMPPVQEWISSLSSLSKTIENMGMVPRARLLDQGEVSNNPDIQNILGTRSSYFIERLRFASLSPIAIERHYYSDKIGRLLSTYDLDTIVIYDVLENDLGFTLWETDETVTSRLATKKEAILLDIPANTCLLEMKRILFDDKGRIIEYLESVYRSDLYVFKLKRRRK